MKLILHDLSEVEFNKIYKIPNIEEKISEDKIKIISDDRNIKNCIGCFCCWVKKPGECILEDSYQNMGEVLSKTDELIIISECCYGSYSSFIKNVLDRSISYLLPFFKIIDNETHHLVRYKNKFKLKVYFYGENITNEEKNTAHKMIKANSINLNLKEYRVFFNDFSQLSISEGGQS